LEGDDATETARDVANHGQQLWDVEKILSHKGSLKNKTSLTFRVKWVGSDEITEQTWSLLSNNRLLHHYLIQIGKPHFIPIKYRSNYTDMINSAKSAPADQQLEI
jgi:hypothetical protein